MKKTALSLALLWACSLQATPEVSGVNVVQDGSHMVTVTYNLSEPAIVTVDFRTNDVSIGAANFRNVAGDVNAVVRKSAGVIRWRPHAKDAWPGHVTAAGAFKAVVTAWSLEAPPDWLVADLRMTNAVNFYASEDALPYTIDDLNFRKNLLLMHKITAAGIKWLMGSPAGELGRTDAAETQHFVMLTNDYYIGTFEFTKGQYNAAFGGTYADVTNPVVNISYNTLRGTQFSWPGDLHKVSSTSTLGVLRAITGLEIDFPTDAEWEYACRAGTSTALNSGKNLANKSGVDANMAEVGWYYSNDNKVHGVGLKNPNAWRLYDMHGNVREYCLDWYSEGSDYLATFGAGYQSGDTVIAPVGATSGDKRCDRGSSFNLYSAGARSAARLSYSPASTAASFGFRVVCPARIAVTE